MNHNTVRVRNLLVAIAVFATAFCFLNGCSASNASGVTTTVVALSDDATTNAPEDVATYLCEDILALINPINDGPEWPFTE